MCNTTDEETPARVAYYGSCHTVRWVESKGRYLVAKLGSRYKGDRHLMTREEVLALRPWDDVRAEREAAKNKQPRGHCQICGRSIGIKAGVIAHHGYQRPGWGFQTASCFGARCKPYQESRDAIPEYIELIRDGVKRQQALIDRLQDPSFSESFTITEKWHRKTRAVEVPPGSRRWETIRQHRIRLAQHRIDATPAEIEHFEKRYADWIEPKK